MSNAEQLAEALRLILDDYANPAITRHEIKLRDKARAALAAYEATKAETSPRVTWTNELGAIRYRVEECAKVLWVEVDGRVYYPLTTKAHQLLVAACFGHGKFPAEVDYVPETGFGNTKAEAQPVAWMVEDADGRHFIFRTRKPVVGPGETLTPLYAAPIAQPADSVYCPTSPEQAAGMVSVAMAWLKEHAPDRLRQPAAQQVPADLCERIAEAHDASLDENHRTCRAILTELLRLLAASPQAAPVAAPAHNPAPGVLRDFLGTLPADLGGSRRNELRGTVQRMLNEGFFGGAAQAKAEPLTDEQIIDLVNEACRETFNGLERYRYFARAIERAHGIAATTKETAK